MIPADELLTIKSRLLTGAEAAFRIATSADPVRYEAEEYDAVFSALVLMREDMARVLAELDVLRSVFGEGVGRFLMEEVKRGVPEPGRDVAAVPEPEAAGGGQGEPEIAKGTDGGVQSGRLPRKRAKRSKPRRNPAGDGGVQESVGSGDGASAMDRGEDA